MPTDFDNDRDIDVLALSGGRAPLLMSNLRDGTFGDVAAAVGMPAAASYATAAAADINRTAPPTSSSAAWVPPACWSRATVPAASRHSRCPIRLRDAAAARFVDSRQ